MTTSWTHTYISHHQTDSSVPLLMKFKLAACRGRASSYPSQNTFASIVLADWSTSRRLVVSLRSEAGSRERGYNLKALHTFSNCQRPVFSCGVSQHMHRTVHLWQFDSIGCRFWRDNNGRKKYNCHTKSCAFRCLISGPQTSNFEVSKSNSSNLL